MDKQHQIYELLLNTIETIKEIDDQFLYIRQLERILEELGKDNRWAEEILK